MAGETSSTQDPAFEPLLLRNDGFSEAELKWIFTNIKIPNSPDVTDANNQNAGKGSFTDAFGRLFKREHTRRKLHAWFLRIDAETDVETLEGVFKRLHIKDEKHVPLHIHCIEDYFIDHDDCIDNCSKNPDAQLGKKVKEDFKSLLETTVGIVFTWSGLRNSTVHAALEGVNLEEKLLSVATPFWSDVTNAMKTQLGGNRENNTESKSVDLSDQNTLGDEISLHSNHFLLLDRVASQGEGSSDEKRRAFRHFHCHMIEAIESDRKEVPVVCVLFHGGKDALKMVNFALERKIPVLVVKGSGGYADVIAKIYNEAELKTKKEWTESGEIYTRCRKVPSTVQRWKYLTKSKQLANICFHLDMITVYEPGSSLLSLDSVIFEAVLKHKQPEKLSLLVRMMKQVKATCSQTSADQAFIALSERHMDSFITALKQNSADMVRVLLTDLGLADKFMEYFHMGRVLQLYNDQNMEKWNTMKDIRKKLEKLLEHLSYFPLHCHVTSCHNCNTDTASEKSKHERTCLHPMQELFLWSLYKESLDLALVFWERCNDKIVAALFAWKVFRLYAEKKDPEEKLQMTEAAKQFQTLAIDTLKSCDQIDEVKTENLLTKPCAWWGDVSVLQMAIMVGNKVFLEQTACRNVMRHIWKGEPPLYPDPVSGQKIRRPCQFVDSDETGKNCNCCRLQTAVDHFRQKMKCMNLMQSPRFKFGLSFIFQVAFLVLFSGVLLFDLHHGITYYFGVLSVWVLAICVEEVRQFVFRDPVLKNNSTAKRRSFKVYFQLWNVLDMCTIFFFVLGFLLIVIPSDPIDQKQIFAGRSILCLDFIFFCIRFLQMLIIMHDELGLMVIMVGKMVGDTWRFFVILMICVLSYAVVSESLLYQENEISWSRFYHVPRKAYWQVFGELSLEEIENNDDTCASGNNSKHYGNDVPHCPSEAGSKVVPFLLGAYILLTNVLLINLLIARFGVTFSKVLGKAGTVQAWHRCQITVEYFGRPILPPPFNLICIISEVFFFFLDKVQRCSCSKCCKADGHEQQGNGEGIELVDRVSTHRALDGQSMGISWWNTLEVQNGDRNYTVKLCKEDPEAISQPEKVTYTVAQKPLSVPHCPSKQALTVWDLDPCYRYIVEVEDKTVSDGDQEVERKTLLSEAYQGILKFENDEMHRVLNKKKASDRIFTELAKASASTKDEIGKIPKKFTEEMGKLNAEVKTHLTNSIGTKPIKERLETVQNNMVSLEKEQKAQSDEFEKLMKNHQQQMEEFFRLFIQESVQKEQKRLQDLLEQQQEMQHQQQLTGQQNQQQIQELLQKQQSQIQDLLQQQQELQQQLQLQQL